ncbi:MAG: hypothetical protein WC967_15650 [Balneolaceae bacterium]
MYKNIKVDFEKFMQVIDKCEKDIFIITAEGDKFNMKSKLSQLVALGTLFKNGQIEIDHLETTCAADDSRVFRFLIYGEVERE